MPIHYPGWLTSKRKPLPKKARRGPVGGATRFGLANGPLREVGQTSLPLRTASTLSFCFRGACGRCGPDHNGYGLLWVPA